MKIDIYGPCDKAIQAMNRDNLEAFGRLKMTNFDEVKTIKVVKAVYIASARRARKRYYEVGFEAYLLAMAICGTEPKKAHQMAEKAITDEWVKAILSETDFVTLFRFDTETERKAYRLAEALEVSKDRDFEVNKALRFWSQQLGQYAINITDYAVIQAYMDAGVEMVEWDGVHDGKMCNECHSYDGQVFRLDSIPPKPHWGCRCRYLPVFQKAKASEMASDQKPKEL